MNPVINKFLVAAVTVLGAIGAIISDGTEITAQEIIGFVILGFNALGVYGIANEVVSRKSTTLSK